MADRFYVNCPLAPGPVVLQGPEAHHLATVCRVRPNDLVSLFNGDGHQYPARVLAAGRHKVELEVLAVESPERELSFALTVAAPLPKGDRAQFLLEKLTELGVTTYVPLRTRRSVVHPGEARLEKLHRYVIEASKQCGRNVLMRVGPMAEWSTYCQRPDLPEMKVLAHPMLRHPSASATEAGAGDTTLFPSPPPLFPSHPLTLSPSHPPPATRHPPRSAAVGPEGGFTDEEVEQAQTAHWQTADLGARILRVETAAIVLATWLGAGVRLS